jgi:hypothetical protein
VGSADGIRAFSGGNARLERGELQKVPHFMRVSALPVAKGARRIISSRRATGREKFFFGTHRGAQVVVITAVGARRRARIDTLSHADHVTPLTSVLAGVKSAPRIDHKPIDSSAVQ